MDISEDQKEILNSIENQIRVETQKHDSALKKLNPQAKIILENFRIVKDSFSGPKMYQKIYAKDDFIAVKFFHKENDKKKRN